VSFAGIWILGAMVSWEVSEQQGKLFGFGGSQEVAPRDGVVEFPRGRAGDDGERKLRGEQNAKESVGGDKEKTRRGGAKDCVKEGNTVRGCALILTAARLRGPVRLYNLHGGRRGKFILELQLRLVSHTNMY
jgi:hypothetical protein